MKFLASGLLILFLAAALPGYADSKRMAAAYCRNPIRIDGRLNDWAMKDAGAFTLKSTESRYDNVIAVNLAWDERCLYGCFRVSDQYLVGLEPSAAKQRLMYNDGVEFYIDSHNDSRDTMDLNDYQFSMDINGNSAVFRGDRLDRYLKFSVPKEEGVANIVFRSAVRCIGTVNRMEDRDSMYQVEFAVDWASIGVIPLTGMEFNADLCVNDNDTLVDFRLLPEGPVSLLNFSSFGGSADFGYPNRWIKVILTGSASIHGGLSALFSVSGFLIAVAAVAAAFLLFAIVSRAFRTQRAKVRVNSVFEEVPAGSGAIMQQQAGFHPDQPVIVHAREYINSNISEPLRPEQLAGGLGVSLRNLERIFKREMNMTPNAFITLIRIEFAAGMLSSGIHNIAEVADAAGFNDPAYFSRVFKKHYGQTPREYHSNNQKAGRI